MGEKPPLKWGGSPACSLGCMRHRRERQCGSLACLLLLPAAECIHPCSRHPHPTSFMVLTCYRLCEAPRGFSRPSALDQSHRGSTRPVHRATLRFSASVVGRRSCGVIQPLMCRPVWELSPFTHSCSVLLFLLDNPDSLFQILP